MHTPLLHEDTPDHLTRTLLAWRLWLAGALLGALLGAAWYAVAPPPYRAEATVVVDMNLEASWEYFTDRQLFQFMERESRKLEAIVWSDAVLADVAAELGGVRVEELRNEVLQLSQPAEGAWHFWAHDTDADRAADLAGAWATAFAAHTIESLTSSDELIDLRDAIDAQFAGSNEPDQEALEAYFGEMALLLQDAAGISPYTEISVNSAEYPSVQRTVPQAMYLLGGSVLGALAAGLLGLLRPPTPPRHD